MYYARPSTKINRNSGAHFHDFSIWVCDNYDASHATHKVCNRGYNGVAGAGPTNYLCVAAKVIALMLGSKYPLLKGVLGPQHYSDPCYGLSQLTCLRQNLADILEGREAVSPTFKNLQFIAV